MSAVVDADVRNAVELARSHGLSLIAETTSFNEMGLDYRVGFATDTDGQRWVLRLPRREGLDEQAEREGAVLELLKQKLPVAVPDWSIREKDLIAYRLLPGQPGLTFDATTHEATWHFDRNAPDYVATLGRTVAALHSISIEQATDAGMPVFTPDQVRQTWLDDLHSVETAFDTRPDMIATLREWISDDTYWPSFSVPIHGDLYVGHVMVQAEGSVVGIIDWTEARISDPAIDFVGHLKVFGESSLEKLLEAYVVSGGRIWSRVAEHCRFIQRASPVTYAVYALKTGSDEHRTAAQDALLADDEN
ncbi:MAG: macrolide 2'-phosphotransferase [Novosphingobium sp.]